MNVVDIIMSFINVPVVFRAFRFIDNISHAYV